MTRRAALAGLATAAWARPGRAGPALPRVAALDWTLAAACLSLGVVPAGVAEQRAYARWVREPALPAGVAELGRRSAPSLEGLAALAPDLILIDGFGEPLRSALERIAPTLALPIYSDAHPLARAEAALRDLGGRLGRNAEADDAAAGAGAAFAQARAALGGAGRRPVLAFNAVDGHTLRVFGRGSLFADTLARLGLASAWDGSTGPWGSATVDLVALLRAPEATLVLVEPVPDAARAMLAGGGLWGELTAGRRLIRLPAVWPFGELTAARRFAVLIAAALTPPVADADAG